MLKKLNSNQLRAVSLAATSRIGQDAAARAYVEMQAIKFTPGTFMALASALCPSKTILESIETLRQQIEAVRCFVEGLPEQIAAESAKDAPAIEAARARIEAIGQEIGRLQRDHRANVDAVLRPLDRWQNLANKGLTFDEIVATGIPRPSVSSVDEARPIWAKLDQDLDRAVSDLVSEREALQGYINTRDPRRLPQGLELPEVRSVNLTLLEGL